MDYKRIEQDHDYVRDPETNAVINTNDQAYENYIKSRKLRNSRRREIEELKSEIDEIKDMLKSLIDNNK
jgi:hypothetical protein